MAGKIKGVTIEIDGDTKKLNDSVKAAASQSSKFASELRDVERLLKLNPKDTVLLAQKQKLLADSVDHTKDQLNALKDAKVAADKKMAAGGEVAQDQYRKLQREIIKAENNLETLGNQASKVNTVLSKDQAIGNLKKMGATAGIAAAAVGVALVGIGAAAIESADELQRQADVTGLSAERLQERRDSMEDQSTRKRGEPSGCQWNILRIGRVDGGAEACERSERLREIMWVDDGMVTRRGEGFTGWDEHLTEVGERSVDVNHRAV